ncbi:MAG: Vacuolar import and degradation protein 27 [Ramalina farinacea]|uniref:Vacuolar import and degradation protein 27 n=1 Tax=Ramalina farinacea TaxID=258253 RepID=A0AA43QX56_9LECA|nr:Vacuolar import and degradation protein 27 [Ramalina farinacea]
MPGLIILPEVKGYASTFSSIKSETDLRLLREIIQGEIDDYYEETDNLQAEPMEWLKSGANHIAQFQHETKTPLAFTPARFNTGLDEKETSIITATGPFIVTGNMKKVLANRKDPYTIKRYEEEVKADNFKYGGDKNVIVALPNEVDMVAKQSFKNPTRESIAASTPRRSSARRRLGREEMVNSPD